MGIFRCHAFIVGMFLMCASIVASADNLVVAGRSAQDVFRNEAVAKLLKAAAHKNISEVKHLGAVGVDVNAVGDGGVTPLLWMLAEHNVDAVRILLDVGADPNQHIQNGVGPAVWLAAGSGQKDVLQVLLDHGGDPNLAFGGKSPLMMAVGGSYLDCAQLLLERGADINYADQLISALDMAMLHVQFGDALWVLNHGYTHDLPMARRMLAIEQPRFGQEKLKEQALEIVDRLLVAQQKNQSAADKK